MKCNKFVKVLLGSLLGILALLGLGVVVASVALFIYSRDYQTEIARKVRAETGRELEIQGGIAPALPWLAVRLGHTALGNPAGFGPDAFVTLEEVDVSARLGPLLHGRFEVGRVRLKGLRLNLTVDAEGRNNWQFQTQDNSPLPDFTVAGVVLEDARIDYSDARSGSRYTLTDLNLQTGPLSTADVAGLSSASADGLLKTLKALNAKGKVTIGGARSGQIDLQDVRIEVD